MMRHDRFSALLARFLILSIVAAVAVMPLAGCKFAKAEAQEPVVEVPVMPEVFFPQAPPPLPPLKYQQGAIFTMGTGTPKQIHLVCADGDDPWPERVIFGCTNMRTDVVLMPNPCFYAWEIYAALACHEQGHVNGWPAHHPDE